MHLNAGGRKRPRKSTGVNDMKETKNNAQIHSGESWILVDELVDTIEEQAGGSRAQGGFGQYNREQLRERLKVVLLSGVEEDHDNPSVESSPDFHFQTRLHWLQKPFIAGIMGDCDLKDIRVCPPLTDTHSAFEDDSDSDGAV